MEFRSHVKTTSLGLTASEVLRASPSVLIGVTQQAEEALRLLKIWSVYDLALSNVFANAARIVDARENADAVIHKHGVAPSDVIDHAARGTPLDELPDRPITALSGIGPQNSTIIGPALGVVSIRDLAQWPPYSAAKRVFVHVLRPDRIDGADTEAPADLVPRSGRHAAQRVSYSTTVLIESKPAKFVQWNGSPIDGTALDAVGFGDVAFGAVLGFTQRWSPRGVALGQLLHSLPLAPGESTKVSVLDWVRRSSTAATEDVAQQESLISSLDQSTAITEVTSAVASEVQEGGSVTGSTSGSASIGAVGMVPMFFVGGGASTNATGAATYTVSSGERSTAAQSIQNISSRTQQNAALTRNRRAAVVSEVSDSESERIHTRQVTNFNHMHAMSVHYFEVVQIYETEARLESIERCMFIPMALVNLRRESNIRRFLPVLVRRALDRELRDLLVAYRSSVVGTVGVDRFASAELSELERMLRALDGTLPKEPTAPGMFPLPDVHEKSILVRRLQRELRALRGGLRANYDGARSKRLLVDFDRSDFAQLSFAPTTEIDGVSWHAGEGIASVRLNLLDGDVIEISQPADMAPTNGGAPPTVGRLVPGITVDRIQSISVKLDVAADANPSDFALRRLFLHLRRQQRREHWLDLSFVTSRRTDSLTVLALRPPVDVRDIAERLMQDQLYYSQQIWMHADRQSLLMQLAAFAYQFPNGDRIRIVDYLDPIPVTVAGNYLAFRFTYEGDADWLAWKKKQHDDAIPKVDLVPMATGGVFAEAVLGEFNSAEKLDATRFWKWDDSPIPHMAPDIAPIEAGKHTVAGSSTPRALPAAGIAMQAPPALPALGSSDQVLRAVIANTIFRDMSGLDIASKLMAASLEAARKGDAAGAEAAKKTAEAFLAAVASVVGAIAPMGGQIVKTGTELGGLINKIVNTGGGGGGDGGGGGGGAAGATSAITQLAGGAGQLAEVAKMIGPIVAEIAPMIQTGLAALAII